jgi:RHS repeat-associated protein
VLAYFYDHIGNFQSKEGINYTYDWYPAHAVNYTSDGNSYTYDTYGNMKSDGMRTIDYNYNNMPVSILVSGATTTFVYGGMGERVKKITPNGGTTTYIGKLYECSSAGTCAKYIFAGGTRIAQRIAGTSDIVYYHPDHLGSTRAMSDTSGNKIEDIQYLPFGKAQVDTGSVSMSHKYTAQEFDAETGLYYYNARYYNPQLGRFISPDTIVPDPANPQALNRYGYALNNPLIYTDPSGQWFGVDDLIAGAVGAVIGAVSAGAQSHWNITAVLRGAAIGAVAGVVGYDTGGQLLVPLVAPDSVR